MKAFEDFDSESEMNIIEVGSPPINHGNNFESVDREGIEFERN